MKNRKAFTLVEMIISVTVFATFMSLALTSYWRIHAWAGEMAQMRMLTFAGTEVMQDLTEALRTMNATVQDSALTLQSLDGTQTLVYQWNPLDKTLSLQEGTEAPKLVTDPAVRVETFKITSTKANPQLFRVELHFSADGVIRPTLNLHLQTAITPRNRAKL